MRWVGCGPLRARPQRGAAGAPGALRAAEPDSGLSKPADDATRTGPAHKPGDPSGPSQAGRGSARLEWFKTLAPASGQSDLRLHTQLFSGYGDSLTDYNFRRTVFSVGLSLLDF